MHGEQTNMIEDDSHQHVPRGKAKLIIKRQRKLRGTKVREKGSLVKTTTRTFKFRRPNLDVTEENGGRPVFPGPRDLAKLFLSTRGRQSEREEGTMKTHSRCRLKSKEQRLKQRNAL